jgi:type IV secretory pathway ATPase VirB11/archaellum biosynthesis ATPase
MPETPGEPTLQDLVANGTMSEEIAATLRATAAGKHSYLVVAIPRFAGKTTVMRAMLAHAPRGTPIQTVEGDGSDVPGVLAASRGGYIVVPEIARMGRHGYIWGPPVQRVFKAVGDGVSLATAIHAPSMEDAIGQITGDNAVPDEDAQKLALVVYIRSLGADVQYPDRRVIATVHEIESVRSGKPKANLLHRWNEQQDRFEKVAEPRRIAAR